MIRLARATVAAGACTLALAPAAIAATPFNPIEPQSPEGAGNTAFENYDRTSRDPSLANNADWPVTMVFVGRASVAKVKLGLSASFPFPGSTVYEAWRQNGTEGWDPDGGIKSRPCSLFGAATHVRLYAPPNGYFVGTGWGRYVVATTHQDRGECGFSPRSGWSEDAEATVSFHAGRRGWTVERDSVPLANAEGEGGVPRREGNHYWQSDGSATVVVVP